MRSAIAVFPLALLMVGCGAVASVSPPPSPAARTPSAAPAAVSGTPAASAIPPTAPAPAYGVLVDLLTAPSIYYANVVGVDGRVWASIKLDKRTPISNQAGHAIELPYVSASSTALYMLAGDWTVWSLRLPDGKQAIATHLQVGANMEAAFAVSPDDSKIAVSVLDFNRSPVHVLLYTDNLGGGNQHVIFESDSDYVWPVAWHSGLLVLAHAYGPYEDDIVKAAPGRDNPYSAVSYHIVDPLTADRIYILGGCTVSGPLGPAGSGCIQGGTIDWQGNVSPPWSTRDWGSASSAAALSPDGRWVAATSPDALDRILIWTLDGRVLTWVDGAGTRDWVGWIDDQHILTGSYLNAGFQSKVYNGVKDEVEHPVSVRGFYATRLPTDIV
ncbi:MAG TPA: hypothetical protein VGA76_09090 [Candidatus Dormibacteraeota bacterium]